MKHTLIAGGRRSGKTTWCVRWVMEKPEKRLMLVRGDVEKRHIINQFRQDYPLLALRQAIYTVDDIKKGRHRGRRANFAIDDSETIPSITIAEAYCAGEDEFITVATADEVIVLDPLKKPQ